MGLSKINLQNYDMVVAVTQNAINETLAFYLQGLQKDVALYFTVDEDTGGFVPTTPDNAIYTFTGTLGYTLDSNGNPVDLVTLNSQGKGVQTVIYSITFSNAEFKSTVSPKFDIHQKVGAPWIINFLVNINQQQVDLQSLTSATKALVQNAVGDLGPDMFSIQQLYLDLNTAVFDTFQNIDNMSGFAGSVLSGIMQVYLADLQAANGIIFGYSVTATPTHQTPPTFMPTALDFCVTLYSDADGNHNNPGLDTLNYLLMLNHNALPPTPPTSFGFNWVDDDALQGVIALRYDHYINFLTDQLNPILTPMCPVCYVKVDANSADNQIIQLNPGNSNSFTPSIPPTLPFYPLDSSVRLASCSYTAEPANDKDSNNWQGIIVMGSLSYSMNCALWLHDQTTITLSGGLVASMSFSITHPSNNEALDMNVEMPQTTFPWSADLVLEMDVDAAHNGQLIYNIQNEQFDLQATTVAPQDESLWQQFCQAASGGQFTIYTSDPGGIRPTIEDTIKGGIQTQLAAVMNTANCFVLPGGNTFLFANPQLSGTYDFVANITYMSPSA